MGMGSDQEDPDGKRNTGHVEDESLGLSGKFGLENPTFLGSLTEVINEIGNPDLEAGHGHHGGGPKTPKMLYEPGEEKRILRNVIVISLAFTLQFTAFNSMSALQSSLNPDVSYLLGHLQRWPAGNDFLQLVSIEKFED